MGKGHCTRVGMCIEETSRMTTSMAKYATKAKMETFMRGIGKKVKSMGMECITGLMEVHTKANTLTVRNTVKV